MVADDERRRGHRPLGRSARRCGLARPWVEQLEQEEWQRCDELAGLPAVPETQRAIAQDLQAISKAFQADAYADSLNALDALIASEEATPHLVSRLGVVRTRVLVREFSDREVARVAANAAATRVAGTDWEVLGKVGVAELHLANWDVGAAAETMPAAIVGKALPTDLLVLLGRIRERQEQWAAANECYDEALTADPRAVEPLLLREIPARLLVRAADRSEDVANRVALLREAVEIGVEGDGDFPDKDVRVALADSLVELSSLGDDEAEGELVAEAAAQYLAAGQRYYWLGYQPAAVELLGKACDLAPGDAVAHWTFAEALRLHAYRPDGVCDRPTLERAEVAIEAGNAIRNPGEGESWVYVTQAKILEDLEIRTEDALLLLEQSVVSDPDYLPGYAFVAAALRRRGFIRAAVEAVEQGLPAGDVAHSLAVETRLDLYLDLEEYDQALSRIDEWSLTQPGPDLVLQEARVRMRRRQFDEVLALLEDAEDSDGVRWLHADAIYAADQPDAAKEDFLELWQDTRSGPTYEIAGWAAFRAGILDEAIAHYTALADHAPADRAYRRDLGQMHLVRGDISLGRRLLTEGIDACPYPGELRYMEDFEFPFVRQEVAQAQFADQVRGVLDELVPRVRERISLLLDPERAPEGVDAVTAAARCALHQGRPGNAFELYRSQLGRLAIARTGMALAGRRARDLGDTKYQAGDHESGRKLWSVVEDGMAADPDVEELVSSLVCRRLLADLVHRAPDGSSWLAEAGEHVDAFGNEMFRAADVVAASPDELWALRAGILRMAEHPDASGRLQRALSELAKSLPIARTYRLNADAADTPWAFLDVPALELHLGPAVADAVDFEALHEALWTFQDDLEQDTGVRVPWIYPVTDQRLDEREVTAEVYGRWVGSTQLPANGDGWIAMIVGHLDKVVRGHLYRLVGVDDVQLWLEGWKLSGHDAPAWNPQDPLAGRLQLARLLRMLLRERVSVADRQAILDVLAPGPSDPLDVLRKVRLRMSAEAWASGRRARSASCLPSWRTGSGRAYGHPRSGSCREQTPTVWSVTSERGYGRHLTTPTW